MPATRNDLFARLDALGIGHHTVEHPAVFTVEESDAIHKHELLPGGHTKNLFLKDKKNRIFLVVALSDAEIDLKSLHKLIGAAGRLSFGRAELLEEVLGIRPGSVTPFALINDTGNRVEPILDARMMSHDLLNYHPLENTATTNIARDDLLKFIRSCGHEPRIVPVDGLGAT
ncbi:MAG: prolyl-tRNA synthetase associated domain-containing protein [Rhizobiales bacterium]|nr:prolyl-tRNA synthetase associated domain-containing protein [Hyphomicrobiales bacterium]